MTTNGILERPTGMPGMDHYDFAELKAAGVPRMSLSLDGATRETHDSFRGVAGTYDRTIEAVRRAHAVGLSLQINTTLTRGNVHPDQFWQDVVLGNVKRMPFSQIWESGNPASREILTSIRSIGRLSPQERQARMTGPCADCKWFEICGGGFRTRAAFTNHGDLWGSDPGCYLAKAEITEKSPALA